MDLKNLKTFLYAAELSSFTRAAEILGYSQPTVSFQIRQLESELNAQLFERINHTVVLTSRGREVMHYAQQMIKLAEDMEHSLHTPAEISGLVRLATADSLYSLIFGPDFSAFRKAYPGIRLKIITAGTEEMFRLLNQNEVDLVLTLDNHIYHTEYVIAQEEQIPVRFVAAASHPLAAKERIELDELMTQPFFLTEKGMSYRRILDETLAARSLELTPVLETGNTEHIRHMVAEGIGLSFLPASAMGDTVKNGEISYLSVPDLSIDVWKQLIYHRDKWVSPAMEAVISYCQSLQAFPCDS